MIEEDIYVAIDVTTCVEERNLPGGPAKAQVEEEIKKGYALLKQGSEAHCSKTMF